MLKAQLRYEYQAFRELMIDERKQQGLTQTDLAKRIGLGMTQSDVSKIERGERRIDIVEFVVISKAMGIDTHEMLTKVEKLVNKRGKKKRNP